MNTLQLSAPLAAPQAFSADTGLEQEVLSFQLGSEEYAIPLRCVQEIRSYQPPTRLAGAQGELLGVIDLRGEIIPLLDLRLRFALPSAEFNALTITVVIQLEEDRRIGIVVDGVRDVVALGAAQIRPMPALRGGPDQRHLQAIGCVDERRLVLLDIESLLRSVARDPLPALH